MARYLTYLTIENEDGLMEIVRRIEHDGPTCDEADNWIGAELTIQERRAVLKETS